MAKFVNRARVCGYLRENNLVADTRNGNGVVRGNVVIAVEEANFAPVDVRVDYYANAGTKAYDGLVKMLPGSAISYKDLKTQYPMMSDEEIKAKASKVEASGSIEENLFKGRDGEMVNTTRIKGFGLFPKDTNFVPYENITANGYVSSLVEETDKEGNATGRLVVNVAVPNCFTKRDGTEVKDAFILKLVCSDPVASYLSTYCSAGSTLPFIARHAVKEAPVSAPVGGGAVVGVNNYVPAPVSVVQELVIIGVSANPIDFTETDGFSAADVREMLATRGVREEKIKNGDETPRPAGTVVLPTPSASVATPALTTAANPAPSVAPNRSGVSSNLSGLGDLTF